MAFKDFFFRLDFSNHALSTSHNLILVLQVNILLRICPHLMQPPFNGMVLVAWTVLAN